MSTVALASPGSRQLASPERATRVGRALPARIGRDPLGIAAAVVLGLLVVLATGADLLAMHLFQYSATQQNLLQAFARPAFERPALWLGADEFGRSVVVRLLYGARVSLGIGVGAALVNLLVGVPLGLASGYHRGWFDDLVQWLIATLHAVPSMSLLLVIAVLFAPGPIQLVVAVGCLTWPNITLHVRGQMLALRERDFVMAARASGAPGWRILVAHLLPNVGGLIITISAIDVGGIMLLESSLSFLGLGIQPPMPSWGNMLTTASQNLTRAPWLVFGPGLAISVSVLCLYLLGDALRDALDPETSTDGQ